MKRMAVVLAVLAGCGGGDATGFYSDSSPNQKTASAMTAGFGKRCSTGADCAGGLTCTDIFSAFHDRECEMPAFGACPAGFDIVRVSGPPTAGNNGNWCMRQCRIDADCNIGQCCLPSGTSSWCWLDDHC